MREKHPENKPLHVGVVYTSYLSNGQKIMNEISFKSYDYDELVKVTTDCLYNHMKEDPNAYCVIQREQFK